LISSKFSFVRQDGEREEKLNMICELVNMICEINFNN